MKLSDLPSLAALLVLPFVASWRESPELPRLSGIVNLPGIKEALFEFPDKPYHGRPQTVLRETDRLEELRVLKILPDLRAVEIGVEGVEAPLTLMLNGESNAAPISAGSIELNKATLLAVLELYAQLSGRTLLYWPSLPSPSLSLSATCRSRAEAAQLLKEALVKRGVATVPDGEKFEMIVPSDQVTEVRPHAPKGKPEGAGAARPAELPPRAIDFAGVELVRAFEVYAAMVGGRFDETAPRPAGVQPFIWLHNQSSLSTEEGVYALNTLFGWQGIKMVRGANGLVRAVQEPRQ